jgi:hypothetical protein
MKDNSDAVFISHTTATNLADAIRLATNTQTNVNTVMLRGEIDGYHIHVQGRGNLSNDAADDWIRHLSV